MTKLKRPFYYCTECKIIIDDLSHMLFVDDHSASSSRGFCSEECIEDFHLPLVKYFEKEELVLREKLNLLNEIISFKLTAPLVDEVLNSPDEIYCFGNDIGDRFYHAIKIMNDKTYVIVITSLFKNEPSYVYGTILTNSPELLDEYRQGEVIAYGQWMKKKDGFEMANEESHEMPDEADLAFMQLLESKKSKILALLLINRKDQDIAIENYSEYDSCFQDTLEHPDEVFEFKDNEGDVLFHYIKNYGSYFYLVLSLKRKSSSLLRETTTYPVLGIPTNDMALVNEFCIGKQLSGPLKN